VEWNDAVVGTLAHADGYGSTVRAYSEKIGIVEKQNSIRRTGDHHPNGLYAFTGPGIPARASGEPVRLVDFYPTVCRLLGIQAPSVDGDVIPGVVAPQI
jgi:predicted AlkP superfamily phosphohydrolase/phosphomutase